MQALQDAYAKARAEAKAKQYAGAAAALEPIYAAGPGSLGQDWYAAMYDLACYAARAGQKERALTVLEASQSNGGSTDADHIATDSDLESLHGDPRFERIFLLARSRERLWLHEPGQDVPYAANLSEDQKVAALSAVWSEARVSFAFFDRQPSLDWNQLFMEYLPKVRATSSTAEFYRVLMRFVAALGDGHTNVYPPDALTDTFYARPGLRPALVGESVVITGVDDPALKAAGWAVGDELLQINGKDVHRYAEEDVAPYVSASTPQDRAVRMYSYMLLRGDVTQPLTLRVRDSSGKESTRVVHRLSTEQAGHLPHGERVGFAMRPDGVAVLTVNEFEDTKGSEVLLAHLAEVQKAKGLIIDVRANGGGNTDVTLLRVLARAPIPGPLQRTRLFRGVDRPWGIMPGWTDLPQDTIDPDPQRHIDVPVAVLTSAMTYSAAEDFVAAFDAIHRGITVGEATGGSTGQPYSFRLPGGGSARICTKNDRAGDGTVFEGVGLRPSVEVKATVRDVRQGADPVEERAAAALLRGDGGGTGKGSGASLRN